MRRNMKKILAILLGTVMTAGLLAGCGSKGGDQTGEAAASVESSVSDEGSEPASGAEESAQGTVESAEGGPDISEHVDITMYLVGDTPETYDDILAKVNEITEREINASLNVKWLSWSEHDTKYSLLFSGKEEMFVRFLPAERAEWE